MEFIVKLTLLTVRPVIGLEVEVLDQVDESIELYLT